MTGKHKEYLLSQIRRNDVKSHTHTHAYRNANVMFQKGKGKRRYFCIFKKVLSIIMHHALAF